ncbi:unnamed protein product, partial [Rotaria magnacalcarata]
MARNAVNQAEADGILHRLVNER